MLIDIGEAEDVRIYIRHPTRKTIKEITVPDLSINGVRVTSRGFPALIYVDL